MAKRKLFKSAYIVFKKIAKFFFFYTEGIVKICWEGLYIDSVSSTKYEIYLISKYNRPYFYSNHKSLERKGKAE